MTKGGGALLSTLASLASLIAALSCCLPLGTLLMAAGSASASIFSERLRPWLLAFSIGALIIAFVQTYVRRRCEFRHRRARTLLLWFSAALVFAMLAFPRTVSTLFAGRLPSFTPASTLYAFDEREFERDFNSAQSQTRIVALLSPT